MRILSLIVIVVLTIVTSCTEAGITSRAVGTNSNSHISLFPYEVSIRRRFCDACAYEHICSGTVYHSKLVITSASCVKGADVKRTNVVAGTSKRLTSAHDGQVFLVEKILEHENADHDIALVYLTSDLKFNDVTIEPVVLATQLPNAGDKAWVAGWGQLSEFEANFDDNLKAIQVPIMDLSVCREAYFWTEVKDTEICAGFLKGGADACQGDAGSPLMVNDKMVGIVSWGYGCARAGNPGVYTNVVMLRDWIAEHS
uniref:Putative trypsin eta-like protein n=1 Tax=Haematobia irritans TaxID=7368 RepID=A0A1L8EBI1_HAEIR